MDPNIRRERLVLNDPIATTCRLFEARPIKNNDLATHVSNESGTLKRSRNKRDGRPPYTEHLRQKLLCEGNRGCWSGSAVLRLKQPSRQSRLCVVKGVACRNLLRLDP